MFNLRSKVMKKEQIQTDILICIKNLVKIWIKSVMCEYSCDKDYLTEFDKRKI